MDVAIRPAVSGDAGEILTLQRAAYVSEAQLYGTPHLPPLVQTLDALAAELDASLALVATLDPGRIVGAVRLAPGDDGVGRIGRLVVAPDLQGRGIGGRLLAAIEEAAPSTIATFELFTGDRSAGNLRLYARAGYVEVRREALGPDVAVVVLQKPRAVGPPAGHGHPPEGLDAP